MPKISDDNFICDDCQVCKPVKKDGGTGYGCDGDKTICYDCCAIRDRASMIETGKGVLYLTQHGPREEGKPGRGFILTNWPGTLRIFLHRAPRVGHHNIAGKRYDVWFTGPDGKKWHGVQYGSNTQICRVHRLKSRARAAKGLDLA